MRWTIQEREPIEQNFYARPGIMSPTEAPISRAMPTKAR
jgi:hypothetical protein